MKKLTAMVLTTAMVCGLGIPVAAEENITLRVLTNETNISAMEETAANFTAENPNITVEVVGAVDLAAFTQNAIASHQADDDYDVITVNHVDTLAFIQGGVISSLQEYIDRDGLDYSKDYFEGLVTMGQFEGETYALPCNTGTRVIAVNKDLFEKYGVEIPQTQEDFLAAAEALTVDGNYGFVNPLCENCYVPTYEMAMFLASDGGSFYDIEDGKAVAKINTPEMKEYLNFVLELLPYMPKDSLTMTSDDARKAFASGNVAMMKYGNWELELIPETEFTLELINVPEGSAGRVAINGGFQFAMGSNSDHKEEAWSFIKYMTTNAEAMALQAGADLPAMNASYDIAPYNDTKYDIFKEALASSVLTAQPVANINEATEEFFSYWTDLLYGKITVDEMCEEAQVSVQEILDENYE